MLYSKVSKLTWIQLEVEFEARQLVTGSRRLMFLAEIYTTWHFKHSSSESTYVSVQIACSIFTHSDLGMFQMSIHAIQHSIVESLQLNVYKELEGSIHCLECFDVVRGSLSAGVSNESFSSSSSFHKILFRGSKVQMFSKIIMHCLHVSKYFPKDPTISSKCSTEYELIRDPL